MSNRAIIACRSHPIQIENLRRVSYHNSTGFKVVNEQEFEKYCCWNKKDDAGIVLAIINEQGEPISSLRANVYFDSTAHAINNPSFAGHTANFVTYLHST
jgi:hypothetical protein